MDGRSARAQLYSRPGPSCGGASTWDWVQRSPPGELEKLHPRSLRSSFRILASEWLVLRLAPHHALMAVLSTSRGSSARMETLAPFGSPSSNAQIILANYPAI